MTVATLFLTCGLQGAGKTTLAKRLEAERPALRLTSDEWMHEFYSGLTAEEREPFRGTVEQLQWSVTVRALELGCDVVLDWGLWSRRGRDELRTGARALGAGVVLCLLDPSRDELWDRLSRRNATLPAGTFHITEAALDRAIGLLEHPTADEFALFDPP